MDELNGLAILTTKSYYYAGEKINGFLNFSLSEDVNIMGIRVFLLGDAKIHWNTSSDFLKRKSQVETNCDAVEEFLKIEKILMSNKINQETLLLKGPHVVWFEFTLPEKLPPSYEHPCARIRYRVQAEFSVTPSLRRQVECTFTALSIANLDTNPALQHPDSYKITRTLKRCNCCDYGNLTATFELFKGGYVPGEYSERILQ